MKYISRQPLLIGTKRGAALVIVLIISVLLVGSMTIVSKLMESRLDIALSSKGRFQSSVIVYSKFNELNYLLATQRRTAVGISQGQITIDSSENSYVTFVGDEIRADGYVHQEDTGLIFSLQNQNGLLSMNSPDHFWLKIWLTNKGVNQSNINRLSDSITDYADEGDWSLPFGAEYKEYQRQNLFSPPNFLIQHCSELLNVLRVKRIVNPLPKLISYCSLSRSPTLNLNAIPVALWQELWPNSAETVRSMRAQNKWFLTENELLLVEPSLMTISNDYYSIYGGGTYFVSVSHGSVLLEANVKAGIGTLAPSTTKITAHPKSFSRFAL